MLTRRRSAKSHHFAHGHAHGSVAIFTDAAIVVSMDAKKISISVGAKELAIAKSIASREGVSLSAIFVRGLGREIEAEARRAALEQLVRDVPPVSGPRKREIRAGWKRKPRAA